MVEELKSNKPYLSYFPKKLQKIAIVYAESEENLTLKKVCVKAGENYEVIKQYILRSKRKRLDFWAVVNDIRYEYLKQNVHRIDLATLEKGFEGSYKDRELFYKRLGLLQETVQHEHKHIHLHHCAPMPVMIPNIEISEED